MFKSSFNFGCFKYMSYKIKFWDLLNTPCNFFGLAVLFQIHTANDWLKWRNVFIVPSWLVLFIFLEPQNFHLLLKIHSTILGTKVKIFLIPIPQISLQPKIISRIIPISKVILVPIIVVLQTCGYVSRGNFDT